MKTSTEIHVGSRTYVPPETIVMIQAEINYSLIYLKNGNKVIVSTCLKKLENRCSKVRYFARVHKSYLINLNFLKSYQDGRFLLENNLSCMASRRKFKKFKADNLENFLK